MSVFHQAGANLLLHCYTVDLYRLPADDRLLELLCSSQQRPFASPGVLAEAAGITRVLMCLICA